eukprot:TRINITY_DN2424_c3_g1_i1.p1 TRINITY_DN2424_c3_g1~~TRINITY_DN2424_c3_g1_i1.p1  ORF type:complete len:223 (+),score=40.49 TRINITY_DN2424_c3_g1_i1:732-1400(+)
MKARNVARKVWRYVRYDFPEMVCPSSLPDPPSVLENALPKLTPREHAEVWRDILLAYAHSWVGRVVDPRETLNRSDRIGTGDASTADFDGRQRRAAEQAEAQREPEGPPSLLEDLAVAARSGAKSMRPALQRAYMGRATAYRDALQAFVSGYREGLEGALREEDAQQHSTSGRQQGTSTVRPSSGVDTSAKLPSSPLPGSLKEPYSEGEVNPSLSKQSSQPP